MQCETVKGLPLDIPGKRYSITGKKQHLFRLTLS